MKLFKAETLQVFKIKEFRLFVLTRFFLTLGVQMQFATISLQIYYQHSKEEYVLGILGLTEAIPFIFTSFFSGYVSDNFSRKKIIVVALCCLLSGATFLYFNSEPFFQLLSNLGMFALFGVVFLFGVIRSFLASSLNPFMSQIVPREQYTSSSTWNTTAWHTGAIMGPVVAGIIFGFNNKLNSNFCHLTEVILFALALFFMLKIKHKGHPERGEKKETIMETMKVGLHFVFKNKLILSVLSLDLFAVLFGGAVALIPAFTDKILHLGPEAYGLLRTAPAIGALAMSGILIFFPLKKTAGKALLFSVAAFGLFTILFALTKNYWLTFAMLFFTGAFDNVSVIIRHSILQLQTPNNMRGRVSAINSVFIGSSNEIGAFESGFTAKLFGLVNSIIIGGVLTIGVVGTINKLNPKLKRLDLSKM
ncbi:MAG: MFS transporter [Bacteroidota bacterium]|nr:MFS transporter [Bacteroidota bacterium]